jgi:hypothetical protein
MAGTMTFGSGSRILFGLWLLPAALPAQAFLDVRAEERSRILAALPAAMAEPIVTITSFPSPRSSGGLHDFHSEGDYWWPDSTDPQAPYVRRDGLTNPANFTAHREALFTMNRTVASLAAGALLTGERRTALRVLEHLRAWFVAPATRMNPHLLYAQAIKGRATGRGIGIIDTIHLIETARAVQELRRTGLLTAEETAPVVEWFAEYLTWMTTHPYGLEERDAKNNHGTWWVTQVAAFASLTENEAWLNSCRSRFRTVLVPTQMAANGSFPLETSRTKPYAYSLFNLEGLAAIALIASKPGNDLWAFRTEDGRGLRQGLEFMVPFIGDRSRWPYPQDVMYANDFPVRFLFLWSGGEAYRSTEAIRLWRTLDADPKIDEVRRNMPLCQPLLWVSLLPSH